MSIIQEALKKANSENTAHKFSGPNTYYEEAALPKKNAVNTRPRSFGGFDKAKAVRLVFIISLVVMAIFLLRLSAISFESLKVRTANNHIVPVKMIAAPVAVTPASDNNPAAEPVKSEPPKAPAFILNGIMYLDGKAQAIINGCILEVGDSLNGATVMLIDKDYVLLNMNDAKIKLKITK